MKMSNFILYTATSVALILSATTFNVNCHNSNNKDLDDVKTPRQSAYVGPFKIETFYNQTNLKDKLRLGKSYLKLKISDKQLPDSLYGSMKLSRLEELIRCDNLTLEVAEAKPLLECQPIESFVEDIQDKDPGIAVGGGFVRRSSVRTKPKLPKFIPQVIQEIKVYPLKKEVVVKNIKELSEQQNLTDLGFTNLKVDLGYYYEYSLKQHRDELDPVICSGKVYLSVNRTEVLARYSDDQFPEFIDEVWHFIGQGWKNGYLLSFQDVSCSKTGYASFFSLTGSFTIIQRLKFPYMTVRHTVAASPIKAILDYSAEVNQTLDPEAGANAYNTTVRIETYSGFFDLMNFKLEQVFANEDLENGIENMKLIHAKHGVALVNSIWNGDGLMKAISLMSSNIADLAGSSDETKPTLKETLKVEYSNKKDEDYHELAMKVKKNLIEPLLNNPFLQLFDSVQDEEEEGLSSEEMPSSTTTSSGDNQEVREEL